MLGATITQETGSPASNQTNHYSSFCPTGHAEPESKFGRTNVTVDYSKCIGMPVTEELSANNVGELAHQLQVPIIVLFPQSSGPRFPIVDPRWSVAHDVDLRFNKLLRVHHTNKDRPILVPSRFVSDG